MNVFSQHKIEEELEQREVDAQEVEQEWSQLTERRKLLSEREAQHRCNVKHMLAGSNDQVQILMNYIVINNNHL